MGRRGLDGARAFGNIQRYFAKINSKKTAPPAEAEGAANHSRFEKPEAGNINRLKRIPRFHRN